MTIKLYEIFKVETLRHRETAKKIIKMIDEQPENSQVSIDFENIAFATRSFLNELLSGTYHKNVKFINMNPDLELMTSIVLESALSEANASM